MARITVTFMCVASAAAAEPEPEEEPEEEVEVDMSGASNVTFRVWLRLSGRMSHHPCLRSSHDRITRSCFEGGDMFGGDDY